MLLPKRGGQGWRPCYPFIEMGASGTHLRGEVEKLEPLEGRYKDDGFGTNYD